MRKPVNDNPAEMNDRAIKQGWRVDSDRFWVRKTTLRDWPFSGGLGFINRGRVYARYASVALMFDDYDRWMAR